MYLTQGLLIIALFPGSPSSVRNVTHIVFDPVSEKCCTQRRESLGMRLVNYTNVAFGTGKNVLFMEVSLTQGYSTVVQDFFLHNQIHTLIVFLSFLHFSPHSHSSLSHSSLSYRSLIHTDVILDIKLHSILHFILVLILVS